MQRASCSPRQYLCVRTEWMFLSSSAEDKGGPKSMCNVSLIPKSNSTRDEHNSQHKVVMMQIITGFCFFFLLQIWPTCQAEFWVSSPYAKLCKPLHSQSFLTYLYIYRKKMPLLPSPPHSPRKKGRLSGAVALIISMRDLRDSSQHGRGMFCAPPTRKGTKARQCFKGFSDLSNP